MVVCAAIVGCSALLFVAPADLGAKSRDSDSSRMQARKIDFPSKHSDSLQPPDDLVDWRYFQLGAPTEVSLRAKFDADDSDATIGLTGATGQEIASAQAKDNSATIVQDLDPGVYYIRVQAQAKTTYKLAVRR
jgi:hypothetical protein